MKEFLCRHRRVHIRLVSVLCAVLLFHICKGIKPAANFIAMHLTTPLKRVLGALCAPVPFSMSEAVIAVLIFCTLGYIAVQIHKLRKEGGSRRDMGYHTALGLLCAGLWVYFGCCMLWGLNYYTDSFQDKSGIYAAAADKEDLYDVAAYFAYRVSAAGALVERGAEGQFAVDQDAFFPLAPHVYDGIVQEMPFLEWNDRVPKKVAFSWFMSYTGYTGFYFPFTDEANINYLAPNQLMPATIAHEMAHQRGIAGEDEANFVAVLACTTSGLEAYEYAGYLLGYIHLSNALYRADYELWLELNEMISPEVVADISANNAYWNAHEGIVSTVSNGIYDNFLKGYGQASGLASYGEVTDLLIAYYRDAARFEAEHMRAGQETESTSPNT